MKTQLVPEEVYESIFEITWGVYKNAYSPYCSPYLSYGTGKGNLTKYHNIVSLMIIFFILITWMLNK